MQWLLRSTEPEQVSGDLPCVSCGYNLRTLAIDRRCPECGEAVFRSVHPDLVGVDLAWLRTVRLGAAMSAWGVVGMVVAMLAGFCMAVVPVVWVLRATFLLGLIAYTVGSFLLTRREPQTRPRPITVAMAVRICPILFGAEPALMAVLRIPFGVLSVVVTLPLWSLLVTVHVRSLAKRMSAENCVAFADFVLRVNVVAAAIAIAVLGSAAWAALGGRPLIAFGGFAGFPGSVCCLTPVGFGLVGAAQWILLVSVRDMLDLVISRAMSLR